MWLPGGGDTWLTLQLSLPSSQPTSSLSSDTNWLTPETNRAPDAGPRGMRDRGTYHLVSSNVWKQLNLKTNWMKSGWAKQLLCETLGGGRKGPASGAEAWAATLLTKPVSSFNFIGAVGWMEGASS